MIGSVFLFQKSLPALQKEQFRVCGNGPQVCVRQAFQHINGASQIVHARLDGPGIGFIHGAAQFPHLSGENIQQRADLVGAIRSSFHSRLDSGCLHLGNGGGKLRELFRYGGDVKGFHHQEGRFRFNVDFLVEYFRLDFMAGVEFYGADHFVLFKKCLGLGRFQSGQGFNGAGDVGEVAAFRFLYPGFSVAVSAE